MKNVPREGNGQHEEKQFVVHAGGRNAGLTTQRRLIIEASDFKFWTENKKDGEHLVSGRELKLRFKAWLLSKEVDWLEYYAAEMVIRVFLTAPEGVNSTFQEKDMPQFTALLKPDIWESIDARKK